MTQEHPITPPPELVREWQIKIEYCSKRADREALVSKVFQLGADYELNACCEWLDEVGPSAIPLWGNDLRKDRRPKPPNLKERNLKYLDVMERDGHYSPEIISDLRQALESLPD